MKGISKKLIEAIAKSENEQFAEETEKRVAALVSLAVEDLSKTVPFISVQNCLLQPVNETFNGAITPDSEFIYFLGFESPQIELNCIQYNDGWKKFKERLIYAWNASKRKKKKKRRKKGEPQELAVTAYEYQDAGKYNLDALKEDLQKAFVKNLTTTSIVYNQERYLRVIGRDEFGSKTQIYIYPCIMEGNDFKFFISRKKGFYTINFENRVKFLNEKMEKVGENFLSMIKILNTMFRNTRNSSIPNQIFIESLLYNTPDELFEGSDIYEVFIKIVNFLNMTDVSQFKSILNADMKISEDKATKSNQIAFVKFLGSLNEIN